MNFYKWLAFSALLLLQSCASQRAENMPKELVYKIFQSYNNTDISMRSIATGHAASEKNPLRLPRIKLGGFSRANLDFSLYVTDDLNCKNNLTQLFADPELWQLLAAAPVFESLTGQYHLKVVLVNPVNFDFKQNSEGGAANITFVYPYPCQKSDELFHLMANVFSLAFHEMAHVELFLIWPDGWPGSFWPQPDEGWIVTVNELVASQYQHCTYLISPLTQLAGVSVSIPPNVKATDLTQAVIQQEFVQNTEVPKSTRRSAVGALLAKIQLNALVDGKRSNEVNKRILDSFCRNVLTDSNIRSQLELLSPYKHLL